MSNTRTILLVRTRLKNPNDATKVSFRWAESVKQEFEGKGWQVIDLALNNALRPKVEEALRESQSALFLFYGHGLQDSMKGQDGMPVINLDNRDLLKDKKVYVVACWTAKQLGPALQSIARCYLGYDNTLKVALNYPYSEHFEKCVNKGILEMLNAPNCSIKQARQHIYDEYSHWIDHFSIGAGSSGLLSTLFAASLRHNRDTLQIFGDMSARLTDD
jgi:hypothetical protein